MKLFFALSSIVLSVYLFSAIEAAPEVRHKRALYQEKCPDYAKTPKDCTAYAVEKSKNEKHCHRFLVSSDWIEWQSCGVVSCSGENVKLMDEDLSKPYPDCCQRCIIINPSKPAEISGVL